ncbi:hypothetical protein [uncultured Alteromonas sp.]|jgi:hypothetical protein|uniref:hypothetical protein n=1 Tax=uncultured Alteromonas sp. TaxID=179113 RepID=UPI0025F81552|nr:hypothetical protein [uncultured Alteromonas sp.]
MQSDASIQQDLKLQEILSLNLPKVWREIAIAIGPDNFVKIWRIVSTPELCNTDNKLYVPSINKYLEYQRSQIIKSLLNDNKSKKEIIDELSRHGFELSTDTLSRIIRKITQ